MLQKARNVAYFKLRSLERFFATDLVYLVKGGGWLTVSQLFTVITGLALLVLFTNFLPKEAYGTYRYVLSFAAILSVFSLRGVSTSLIQSVARGFEGNLSEAVKIKLKWSLGITIVGLTIAGYYFVKDNMVLSASFALLALLQPIMNSLYLYRAVLNGRKQFSQMAVYEIVSHIFSLIAMGVAVYLSDSVVVIIAVYFLHYITIRAALLFYTTRTLSLNKERDPDALRYGKHLSLMKAISIVAGQLDKVLIFHFLGAAPLAIYALAITPIDQIRSFVNNLRPLALPKFSNTDLSDLKKSLPGKVFKLELLLLPVIIIYILAAPTIFQLVFPEYLEAVIYSQVLAISLIFIPRTLYTVAFTAQKKTKELYIVRIASPIFRTLIMTILVIYYGIWGVVAGLLISELFQYILYFGLFKNLKDETALSS